MGWPALVALDGLFSDDRASVDTGVFNASRIWKVYGTIARKGDSTGSRPHRGSRLISVPDRIGIVTREQLATLTITDSRPYPGGDLYRLDACPFSSAHTDGVFAIPFASGAVYADCHHASSGGGSQQWPELREMYGRPKASAAYEEKEATWRKKKATIREAGPTRTTKSRRRWRLLRRPAR